MDFDFIRQVLPLYVEAAGLTIRIALAGIVLSFVVGLACALVRYYRVPVVRRIAGVYIELSRNTPLLIQLFFLYFAFPHLNVLDNILLGPMKAQGRDRKDVEPEAVAWLERVGLPDKAKAYPRQLSGGQKQRVAIVRARTVLQQSVERAGQEVPRELHVPRAQEKIEKNKDYPLT